MRLLVIRASAMGDVALVTPVLKEMRKKFPETEIVMLTRSSFKAFFAEDDHLTVYSPDFKGRHKGLPGIFKLYNDLIRLYRIDHVIDLHDVLRSKILRTLFRAGRTPVSVVDKGRKEKASLLAGKSKVQLKHTVIRYCDAFKIAGFILEPTDKQPIVPKNGLNRADEVFRIRHYKNIGVAPYALHKLKMWPVENMIMLLNKISEKYDAGFFLFGSREEAQKLEGISNRVKNAANLSGKLTLEEELYVMSKLDFMIAMDSSNMHMAALVGTKVVSVWGGTDPFSGFGAWCQPEEYSVRISVDELTCRPCTTFGKGECKRGDFACMNWLTPEMVYQKIKETGLI